MCQFDSLPILPAGTPPQKIPAGYEGFSWSLLNYQSCPAALCPAGGPPVAGFSAPNVAVSNPVNGLDGPLPVGVISAPPGKTYTLKGFALYDMLRVSDLTGAGFVTLACLRANDGSVGQDFYVAPDADYVYRITPAVLGGTQWRDIVFCVVSLQAGTVPGLPGVAPRAPFMLDGVEVCLDRA